MITISLALFLIISFALIFLEKERLPMANRAGDIETGWATGNSTQMETFVYIFFAFIAVMLVGFRTPGVDADSMQYQGLYYSFDSAEGELMEPSFIVICSCARFFNEVQLVFLFYALLAIPLKAYAIFRLSHFKIVSLMIWIAHFFLLQDMTQIRVAVSTGIFLFALPHLINGNKGKYLALCLLAVFFHYSALILFSLVVFGSKKLNKAWRIILFMAPLAFYVMYFKGIDLVRLLPLGMFQEKLDAYEQLRDKGVAGDEINIFNMLAMFRLLVYYVLLIMYNIVYERCHEVSLYLKIYCVSICCYVGLSFLPALAIRGSEVFAVIDTVAIPCMIYLVRPSWVMKSVLGIFAIGLYVMNIVLSRYVREFV